MKVFSYYYCKSVSGICHHKPSSMTDTFNYTTIFAPLGFFITGILLVTLLNRFIGKSQNKKAG